MFDLRSLDGTICIGEPSALKRAIIAAASMPCFSGRQVAEERSKRMASAKQAAAKAVKAAKGTVGVIGIHGPIQQRLTSELMKSGGTSCDEISVALDALVSDPQCGAVVLHIDSPGGSVPGIEELSDKIFDAGAKKPIYTSVDSQMASAALWLGTAASNVSITPGGEAGSHGVYCVHVDQSQMLEDMGVSLTYVSAGKYKTELASTGPLGDEARAYLQASVDYTFGKFTAALARNRGMTKGAVQEKFGQGRMLSADDAVAAGMCDAVRTFEQLLQQLLR